ncbi:uncharacterized protein A4U43_C03F18640 [Asparagus officinalis]|uniref:Uncharacterized protein n=1 Tax=Asparagus officinalis TaxID=4686 RepID=A0A5P1FC43_ASPOF|nr:uncharacterized protein A4U43_C03F18640 [Asparagus officinalis]
MDMLTRQHALQSFEKDSATVVGKAELLQNCDLPHPARLCSPTAYDDSKPTCPPNRYGSGSRQNQSLLRALQLSQTRAREAERKTTEANVRKEQVTALLLEDSLRLHAARQWVRLLEMEILLLRRRSDGGEAVRDEAASVFTWCLSLALCLGIAGVGYMSCSGKCRS